MLLKIRNTFLDINNLFCESYFLSMFNKLGILDYLFRFDK